MAVFRDQVLTQIEDLYRTGHGRFVVVARSITGDRELAAEAVQDGFADAIRSRATFRGDGPLAAWVWRAVVNAALKAKRPVLIEAGMPTADEAAAPAALEELAPLIAALPARQRLVVFLRYHADLDYRSIAEVLDVEVGTVSATLAAAHQTVRRALQEVRADA